MYKRMTWLVVGGGEKHEVTAEEIRAQRDDFWGHDIHDVAIVGLIAASKKWTVRAILAPGVETRQQAVDRAIREGFDLAVEHAEPTTTGFFGARPDIDWRAARTALEKLLALGGMR